jgi:hypothetical protein
LHTGSLGFNPLLVHLLAACYSTLKKKAIDSYQFLVV